MIPVLFPLLLQAVPNARLVHADITFDAKATVADFQGKTQAASGGLTGGATLRDVRGQVEVRWRDIDTGSGTRNRHMLKTVDEERYPTIRFDLREVAPGGGAAADSVPVVLRGELALHGVARAVEWPAALRLDADTLRARADFPLDIRDFGIKPPVRFVVARMGPVVVVHVRLVFVRET